MFTTNKSLVWNDKGVIFVFAQLIVMREYDEKKRYFEFG